MCKIVRIFLILVLGVVIAATAALANESSPPAVEELLQQIKILRTEISQIKQMTNEARDIAVASRMESAKFKEEVLYRLGLWRGKLGEGLMMIIAAEDAAKNAEKMVKETGERVDAVWGKISQTEEKIDLLSSRLREGVLITQELQKRMDSLSMDVEGLKTDVSLAKEMAATAKIQADQAKAQAAQALEEAKIAKELQKRMDSLSMDVEGLKTDVSLAKEMAATAKIQADQARKETRELAEEMKKTKELLLGKLEDILKKTIEWEKMEKAKPKTLKPPREKTYYQVQRGESLWLIAKKVYNDPSAWKKIYEANKDKIISPDLLYPGLRLIIP